MSEHDIKTLIRSDKAIAEIEASLPDHCKPERFVRAVVSAINKTPALAKCNRASFINAMMDCSELGLEPNGRDASFVPFGNQCQLIVSYRGLVKLAYQSGQVSTIETGCVFENDEFDFKTCEHVPHGWLANPSQDSPGKMIGAYCVITKKDGSVHRERMTLAEIEAIRDQSKAAKTGPWKTHFGEMARKTVFKRATKWIELSPHVEAAIEKDYDGYSFQSPGSRRNAGQSAADFLSDLAAKPATEPRRDADEDFDWSENNQESVKATTK